MTTNMREPVQPVESNQKTDIDIVDLMLPDDPRVPDYTLYSDLSRAIDNLTHVVAKLLQTAMLVEKHLADISKAIDRVAR